MTSSKPPSSFDVAYETSKARHAAIESAIAEDRTDIIASLMADISSKEAYAHLVSAARLGRMRAFDIFLAKAARHVEEGMPLLEAAASGRVRMVKRLLPMTLSKDVRHQALLRAIQMGRAQVVKVLLPVADPQRHRQMALRTALVRGNANILDQLWPLSRPLQAGLSVIKEVEWGGSLASDVGMLLEALGGRLDSSERKALWAGVQMVGHDLAEQVPMLRQLVERETLQETLADPEVQRPLPSKARL